VANLALSGLTTWAGDSPLRTGVAHCLPRFSLRGCPTIFPIHSKVMIYTPFLQLSSVPAITVQDTEAKTARLRNSDPIGKRQVLVAPTDGKSRLRTGEASLIDQ